MSKGLFTLTGVVLASATAFLAHAQSIEAPGLRGVMIFPVELTARGPLARVDTEAQPAVDHRVLRAPAPPLTRELVYAVGSTQYGGWEYMTTIGQGTTVGDHGGAQLRVVVQEIGYGNNPLAWMAGSLLPTSANYQNDAICISGNYYVSPCPIGGIVVGWYRYYNLDGWQDNLFQYQNTSTNSPYNTLSTSINIL